MKLPTHTFMKTIFERVMDRPNSNTTINVINGDMKGIPVVIAPGFLTEKSYNWLNYFSKRINAPLIYVNWKSSSQSKILQKSLFPEMPVWVNTFTRPAMSLPIGLPTNSFIEWASASSEAYNAGVDLANILNDIWDNDDKAIFIGHSLGVRVITQAMTLLQHDNVLTSISIAGAISKEKYEQRISGIKSVRTITHSNLYSTDDIILKYFYRIGELSYSSNPIGLTCSDLYNVINHKTNIGHTEHHESADFEKIIMTLYKEALNMI